MTRPTIPWIPAVLRTSRMTEKNPERPEQHGDRALSDVVAYAERHGARAWHGIGAEGLIEYREHRGEVDAGAVGVADMVPAVHGRRNEHAAERAVSPGQIDVHEEPVIVADEIVRGERPGW